MKSLPINRAKTLVCITLLSITLPGKIADAKHANSDSLQTMVSGVVLAGAAYTLNWLGNYFIYNRASSRYELPIAVVAAYANNPNDHSSMYEELLGLVNLDNAQWSKPTSKYHDYPLVEFVSDLEWYITRLTIGSWLSMPTQLSGDMQMLKEQLQRVRFYCVRHPRYIEERRHANQLAAHNASHVVVH